MNTRGVGVGELRIIRLRDGDAEENQEASTGRRLIPLHVFECDR